MVGVWGCCRRGLRVPRALCPLSDFPMSHWVLGPARRQPLAAHQRHRLCDPTSQPRAPVGGNACQDSVGAARACRAGPHSWPGGLGIDWDPCVVWGEQKQMEPCWSGDLEDGPGWRGGVPGICLG